MRRWVWSWIGDVLDRGPSGHLRVLEYMHLGCLGGLMVLGSPRLTMPSSGISCYLLAFSLYIR